MSAQPFLTLNDGHSIPQLGFGVWQVPNNATALIAQAAIAAGYRAIDTAAAYENEAGVGAAIKASSVPREQLFVTTKLWNSRHGYREALDSFDKSLSRLGLDYVDLFLIHWPVPRKNRYVETWQALIEMQKQGRARSIGVSNFNTSHLQEIIDATGVTPAINQIELHPRFQQKSLRQFHQRAGIATQAWSPLGQGQLLEDHTIAQIADQYQRSPAQIILRWHLDNGIIAIPKSATPARVRENFEVFDFHLESEDMRTIAALDQIGGRIGPDPETADF